MLPEPVLEQAQSAILNFDGQGISILEIGHRTEAFYAFAAKTREDLKSLLGIPDTHDILFTSCGTNAHFSIIPQNLLAAYAVMDYVDTGYWSKRAISQAAKIGHVNIVCSASTLNARKIPDESEWRYSKNAAFLHYTDNETIEGIEFFHTPSSTLSPLVCDMTSSLCSKQIPIEKFGLIYAGTQKNIGIAGMSVLIIHKDLLLRSEASIPDYFNYQKIAQAQSLYSTPAVFSWYVTGLMLRWMLASGGIEYFEAQSQLKSQLLYNYIDKDEFYTTPVDIPYRSRMNVIVDLSNQTLEKVFLEEAKARGMVGLRGHRSRGGLRISLYNVITLSMVEALVAFMEDFKKRYG